MNATPKVSVIIVTYNQADTIARTIESVLSQECDFPIELVIGDDASTDDTLSVARSYADRYDNIRILTSEVNRGVTANYTDCIRACRGTYIADCAGDDYWIDTHKLACQVAVMDSDPAIALVHTGWQYTDCMTGAISPSDVSGVRQKYLKPVTGPGELTLPLLRHDAAPIIHLCTSLYRRDVIMDILSEYPRLFTPGTPCEDLQIAVMLAAKGRIAYIPDVTLNYSVGHKSISSEENYAKNFDFQSGIISLTRQLQRTLGIADDQLADFYSSRIQYTLAQAWMSRDPHLFSRWKELSKELPFNPSVKTRLLSAIMGNGLLWRLSLTLNSLLR